MLIAVTKEQKPFKLLQVFFDTNTACKESALLLLVRAQLSEKILALVFPRDLQQQNDGVTSIKHTLAVAVLYVLYRHGSVVTHATLPKAPFSFFACRASYIYWRHLVPCINKYI